MSGRCASCAMRSACRRRAITRGDHGRKARAKSPIASCWSISGGFMRSTGNGTGRRASMPSCVPKAGPPAASGWSGSCAGMVSGLGGRAATVYAQPTASIRCRSRPTCSIGISWPRSLIRSGWRISPTSSEGWLYLAVILDLFTRKVVGWAMREHMRAELTMAALTMAIQRRRPAPGLMHHSDRGSQYAAGDYRKILHAAAITPSMSRKGNCWDNAPMESFFGTLKTELVHQRDYPDRDAARRDLFAYIEGYYDRRRIHSATGYMPQEQAAPKTKQPGPPFPGGSPLPR